MKLLITLKDQNESKEFLKELDINELRDNIDFFYPSGLDLTIRDHDIFVSFIGGNLWIENEDYVLLRVPLNIIKDFVVKESK